MSQPNSVQLPTTPPLGGTEMVLQINATTLALLSQSKGAEPPAYRESGALWLYDGDGAWELRQFYGSGPTDYVVLGELPEIAGVRVWVPYSRGEAAGTAFGLDTGTDEGEVPVLGEGGLLPASTQFAPNPASGTPFDRLRVNADRTAYEFTAPGWEFVERIVQSSNDAPVSAIIIPDLANYERVMILADGLRSTVANDGLNFQVSDDGGSNFYSGSSDYARSMFSTGGDGTGNVSATAIANNSFVNLTQNFDSTSNTPGASVSAEIFLGGQIGTGGNARPRLIRSDWSGRAPTATASSTQRGGYCIGEVQATTNRVTDIRLFWANGNFERARILVMGLRG